MQRALRVFEDAGAIVEEVHLGFSANHLELGELWCRLIVSSQIEGLDQLKANGIDILRDHPSDLSELHRRWINLVLSASTRDRNRDQLLRTMVYERVQADQISSRVSAAPNLSSFTP